MLKLAGLAAWFAAGSERAKAQGAADFLPVDFIAGAWLVYRDRYLKSDGRVVDERAGGISHSESQGYGMLLSVSADERRDFQRIWDWTRNHLYVRGDRLAAWKWDPDSTPHIADTNNATDGDVLIAWALTRAAAQWNIPEYAAQARAITDAIVESAVADSPYGKILQPGAAGFGPQDRKDGPVVNLSYWVYPALVELGKAHPDFPASELIETGLKLTRLSRFGSTALPADWISLKGDAPHPAADYPVMFGYDAVRVPLYLAWFSQVDRDILEVFAGNWSDPDLPGVSVVELETATRVSPMRDPGYAAIAELVSCSLGQTKTAVQITAFDTTSYYPSTLHILCLVALTERYPECLPNLQ